MDTSGDALLRRHKECELVVLEGQTAFGIPSAWTDRYSHGIHVSCYSEGEA